MSVHVDVSKSSFFGLDEWSVAVCAWRGCCMEVFARAEHSVASCLRALEEAGIATGKESRSPAAASRLKALNACIAGHDFGKQGDVAQTRIAAWERCYELRAFLAHGTVKPTRDGVSIQHRVFDGKAERCLPVRHMGRIAMLEALAELEQAQIKLHQQLGQIKALALKAKPMPIEPTKPDPGSSRGGGPAPHPRYSPSIRS